MDKIRDAVRAIMRQVARALNKITGGHLSPNAVTIIGLLAHLPIAYFIAFGKLELAAILLVIFGLFDTLDGELARLQKRTSNIGRFLDSTTDRMKEIILYTGIVYFLVSNNMANYAVWATVALGASVLTSYINAWGDAVVSNSNIVHTNVNKAFRGGILRFEIRMFLLFVALLADKLQWFVVIIAVLASITACQRIFMVIKRLRDHV